MDNVSPNNVYDHQNRIYDHFRKPQIGRNMLIPQEEDSQDEGYVTPTQAKRTSQEEKGPEENPRFYYFILI